MNDAILIEDGRIAGRPARRLALIGLWHQHADTLRTIAGAMASQALLVATGIGTARLLGPEDRGHLQLLVLLPLLLGRLGTFGIPTAVTYYVARSPESSRPILQLLARPAVIVCLALVFVMLAISGVAFSASSESVRLTALLMPLAIPGTVCQLLGQAILQGQQRFVSFNILRNLQLMFYAAAAIALFLVSADNLPIVAAVWTATTLVAGIATLVYALRTSMPAGALNTSLAQLRAFGLRSLPSTSSPVEMLKLDQILLGIVAGPFALGLYVVGLSFSNLPRFIAQSVGMVAYPRISRLAEPNFAQVLRWSFGGTAICCFIVLALELAATWLVPVFFGPAYDTSVDVARIALLAALLMSVRRILSDCSRGYGWPEMGSKAELLSSSIALSLVVLFGLQWGAVGAAWGLTIGALGGLLFLVLLLVGARRDARPSGRDQIEEVVA